MNDITDNPNELCEPSPQRVRTPDNSGRSTPEPTTIKVRPSRGRRGVALRPIRVIKKHALASLITCFLAIGAVGAGLKYLDDSAKNTLADRKTHGHLSNPTRNSWLETINPFLPAPAPPAPPPLARDYIYADSRLLTIEDANAGQIPPADLAVWRPSSGAWWILGGTGSQQFQQVWGATGDIPEQGDFDGDGKTDLAIFRPSSNTWWLLKSSTGTYDALTFGIAGDRPVVADFDGDASSDIAVFRPSNSTWYIRQSLSGNVVTAPFGSTGDVPTPKDFDGDGRADLAVWRPATATFYALGSSSGSVASATFPQTAATPVPADFDGDGRADFAIRENTTGNWVVRGSLDDRTQTIAWQAANDVAVANDYDGDGKVDVAVWRNSNGNWFIRQSSKVGTTAELRQTAWGTTGDIPVPAFYRR